MCIFAPPNAKVAELVDALDSKSSDSNIVRVRFPPLVQKVEIKRFQPFLFFQKITIFEKILQKVVTILYFIKSYY